MLKEEIYAYRRAKTQEAVDFIINLTDDEYMNTGLYTQVAFELANRFGYFANDKQAEAIRYAYAKSRQKRLQKGYK